MALLFRIFPMSGKGWVGFALHFKLSSYEKARRLTTGIDHQWAGKELESTPEAAPRDSPVKKKAAGGQFRCFTMGAKPVASFR
jgi:hypothetical protein